MSKENLTDLNTIPFHMRMNYEKRNNNITSGKKLCLYCSGTGNELYFMYRKCPKCDGSGVYKEGK